MTDSKNLAVSGSREEDYENKELVAVSDDISDINLQELKKQVDEEHQQVVEQLSQKQQERKTLLPEPEQNSSLQQTIQFTGFDIFYQNVPTSPQDAQLFSTTARILQQVESRYKQQDESLLNLYKLMRGTQVSDQLLKKQTDQQTIQMLQTKLPFSPQKIENLTQIQTEMAVKNNFDQKEPSSALNTTSAALSKTAESQYDLFMRKKQKVSESLQMPLPKEQIRALNIDVTLQRELMHKCVDIPTVIQTQNKTVLPQFAVNDDFLMSGIQLPKGVKTNLTRSEAEIQAKKRLFFKLKMQEHAQRCLHSMEGIKLEAEM
ncbi:Conserved_hypothetical protein [Hexamita inflata]|uniref:Uncharacterized protein n=1 Tax=Hexamita inflata TaxID=28002 RepID=A0AA86RAI0_9EUKA|nr:Conserved hypothetical protein [Hexamita inflata]